mgnify:CR=1 FL=1
MDETIHREARGLKRLFMNKLPDFLIDNHGVPSHEWEQQFAGYTSPSFRGFWLPRSLIYGYFFHIDEERYKSNITLNKKMEDVVADAFLQDKKITDINLSWARQFEKYAHTWMPKIIPGELLQEHDQLLDSKPVQSGSQISIGKISVDPECGLCQ